MMRQKAQIRQTALALTLVYLFLSGFVMVGAGGHAHEHEKSAHHAAQHTSFICSWMCAASTFVHSTDQTLSGRINPFVESLTVSHECFVTPLFILPFDIRSPPTFLS